MNAPLANGKRAGHLGPWKFVVVEANRTRRGRLVCVLTRSGRFECVGQYWCVQEALSGIIAEKPEVVVFGNTGTESKQSECVQRMRLLMPDLTVVALGCRIGTHCAERTRSCGGEDPCQESAAGDWCLAPGRFAAISRTKFGTCLAALAAEAAGTVRRPEFALLTPREHQVMRLLAAGLLYKEIASELNMGYATVHKLQHNIF